MGSTPHPAFSPPQINLLRTGTTCLKDLVSNIWSSGPCTRHTRDSCLLQQREGSALHCNSPDLSDDSQDLALVFVVLYAGHYLSIHADIKMNFACISTYWMKLIQYLLRQALSLLGHRLGIGAFKDKSQMLVSNNKSHTSLNATALAFSHHNSLNWYVA